MFASLLVGLALAAGAQDKKDPPAKDPPAKDNPLVGEWVGEKALSGGKDVKLLPGDVAFTFAADGKLTVVEGKREKPDTGTYKADPKKDPAEIDIVRAGDKNAPTVEAIYKLDGDTLTFCFNDKTGKRPTRFESPAGSEATVLTLKRVKK